MKKKYIILTLIIVLIISVIIASVFIIQKMNKTNYNLANNNTMEVDIQNIKNDKSKDILYPANYSIPGLENAWYYCDSLSAERSLNDIKVPYININSKDADNANIEIKKIYDETAKYFKEDYDKAYNIDDEYSEVLFSYTCNYKYYINDSILSLCVIQELSGTDTPYYNYLTYNFDLNTGTNLSFENITKKIGFSKEEVDEKIKKIIENYNGYIYLKERQTEESDSLTEYTIYGINKYKNNDFEFYLDRRGVLNIVIELRVEAGSGYYTAILPVHKEDTKNNYELIKMRETTGCLYIKADEYKYKDMEDSWYTVDVENGKKISFSETVNAPYININSDDAKEANKEIKNEYEKIAKLFETELLSNETSSKKVTNLDYSYCIFDYFLSIVLEEKTIDYKNGREEITYYTYSFDLSTGKKLNYKDLVENMGYTEDEINSKFIEGIKNNSVINTYEGENHNIVLNKVMQNYKDSLKNNQIKACINYDDGITIYIEFENPEYNGLSEIEVSIDDLQK